MSQEPAQIADFNAIINGSLHEFVALSTELGNPVEEAALKAEEAFRQCANLICFALYNDAPPNKVEYFNRHPLNAAIQALTVIFENNRQHPKRDHLQCLSSSILSLNWIAADRNPAQTVIDMRDSGEYFGNRVLRIKEGNNRNWMLKWNQVLKELEAYVRRHFITGFTWGALRAVQGNRGSTVPPPPPPPPVEMDGSRFFQEIGQGDRLNRQELLNELNQGTDITRRLRPTTDRRGPRVHNVPNVSLANDPAECPAPAIRQAGQSSKPPRLELEGRKWAVEYQRNQEGIRVDNNNMSESVSLYSVENSSIEVLNKINSMVIDNCKRTNIMVHGVVGSVSLVRCSRMKIQFDGPCPLVNVDKCDSVQIFLNETSKDTVLITSQSTALNVCLLMDDGDYVELPVPEQIQTKIRGEQLESTVYENRG